MPLKVGCRADDAEKHDFDVNCLLYHKGKLYSGGDDGKIKAWAADLVKVAEIQSNPCSIFSLAASENVLYSCSNEGTIKLFDLETLQGQSILFKDDQIEVWKLVFSGGCLYSGDSDGHLRVWKDNKFYGNFNIAEPVKDVAVCNNLIFTVKDLDLVITDVKLEGKKLQYGTVKSIMGRAPVTLIGDNLFAFISREGMDVVIHENNRENHFKDVTVIKGAHEKIINALAGARWNDKDVLFTGGWDKTVKKWIIERGSAKLDCSADVEIVINSITLGDKGEIYVGGSDGHIVRVEVE